jgi:hypothetical protein
MQPLKILIIRHAEQPSPGLPDRGVDESGAPDANSLTVQGWQRAGALARFFAKPSGGVERPDAIYAAATGRGGRRCIETATPIAASLGRGLISQFATDDARAVMADVLRRQGVVLMVWEREMIPALVQALPDAPPIPEKWPAGRFDLIWELRRAGAGWQFAILPQYLLAGDGPPAV